MSQPVGSHWIRAGNYIKAVGRRPGQKMNQELMGQTAAVRQHIDPAVLRQGSVVQTDGPAVGDRTQKTLLDLARGIRFCRGISRDRMPLARLASFWDSASVSRTALWSSMISAAAPRHR